MPQNPRACSECRYFQPLILSAGECRVEEDLPDFDEEEVVAPPVVGAPAEPPKKKRPYTRRAKTVDPKPGTRAAVGKLPPYVRALLDSEKLTAEAKIEAIRLYDEVGQ